MNMAERRARRYKKIKQRERILNASGLAGGVLYEKHREKIKHSRGYIAKHGTLLHYAQGTNRRSQKTRDRKSHQGTENWSYKDKIRIQDMRQQVKEYQTEYDEDQPL